MKDTNTKKNTGRSRLIDLLILALVIVMAVCAFQIARTLWRYHRGTAAYERIQQEAGTAGNSNGRSGKSSSSSESPSVNWKKLNRKYPDVKAWLYQKGTVINYPVAQSKDNQYYLHRLLDGTWDVKGTLFLDCRNRHPFTKDFLTVIYGHRMRDRSMFWTIADYREGSYMKKHPVMQISTPKQNYRLRIFAAATIPAGSRKYQFDFPDAAAKQDYLDWIRKHADVYDKKTTVTSSDHIVMLSTCAYEFQNARAVVFGKLEPAD